MIKREKISINMAKNSLNKVEDQKQVEVETVANNSTSNNSEMLMISLKNFSEEEIHLPTFSMKKMISLEEVLDKALVEEWWDMDSLVDSEEDLAGEWIKIIKINNKRNKEETEIPLQTLEWWDLDSMKMMTFSEEVFEEASEEEISDHKVDLDKEDSNHSNQVASEGWEEGQVNPSASRRW